MRVHLLPFAVILLLAGPTLARADEPKVPAGVVYCPDLTYCKLDKTVLQLDLAYPKAAKGACPVVVIIHGTGPLTKGRKFNTPLIFDLAERGYVGASISFRHRPGESYPAAIHDVKCAVRWLRAQAGQYPIDKDGFGAIGFSGGGSLACILGMTTDSKATAATSTSPAGSRRS